MADRYHHGDLRAAILDRARAIITDEGVEALSLRAVAAELGVSHAAPRHHFPTRRALLTAIATEGFAELAERNAEAARTDGSFLAAGLAYVRFALDHPADFQVMFTPELLDHSDQALEDAAAIALAHLRQGAEGEHDDGDAAALAGWSLVHGLAQLARSGTLARVGFLPQGATDDDLLALAARAAGLIAPREG